MILYINNEHCENIEQLKNYFINDLNNQNVIDDILDYGRSGDIAEWLRELGEEQYADRIDAIDNNLGDTEYLSKLAKILTSINIDVPKKSCKECLLIENISCEQEDNDNVNVILSFKILDNINEKYDIVVHTNWGNQRTFIRLSDYKKKYSSKMKFYFHRNSSLHYFAGVDKISIGGQDINVEKQTKNLYQDVYDATHIDFEEVIDNNSELQKHNNLINGHEYVDLGLPSGLKWATCNVGADSPEEYGDYFAWGETKSKNMYIQENSITHGTRIGNIDCSLSYDAARAHWGICWRLPTKKEIEELINICSWRWTRQNKVNGYKVTGPNGNSIFLPATGYIYGNPNCMNSNTIGCYWSSIPGGDYYHNDEAYYLRFDNQSHYIAKQGRYYGRSIRPVVRFNNN